MSPNRAQSTSNPRLAGIDSIRFWLAIWVYFSHFGFLPFAHWVGTSTASRQVLSGLANNLFNGAGAVIGFFVISGLCIHYPYRDKPIELLPFYVRRYLRILIPLGVALGLGRLVGNDIIGFYQSILWSLIAEEIYYAAYPLLKFGLKKLGWSIAVSVSFAAAAVIVATNPRALNFHQFGPNLTWIVGLPAWLLGCHLAETAAAATAQSVSTREIWIWRLSIWGLGSAANILRFHAGIGFPITLTAMSPLLYCWIRKELGRPRRIGVFEYAGKFSYSIYLMHGIAVLLLRLAFPKLSGPTAIASLLSLAFVIAFSYAFYLLVERPSHEFARRAARFAGQIHTRKLRKHESGRDAAASSR